MDILDGAGKREREEADRIAALAEQAAGAAISQSALMAASVAIGLVQRNDGGGVIGEPAADLRRLRTDSRLMPTVKRDLTVAQATAERLLLDALWMGYRTALEGRAAAMSTGRLTVKATATEGDRRELADYPIYGHRAAEVAASLVARLAYEVDGALAAPLTGTIDPGAIGPALGAISGAHGGRVRMAVGEAYFTGVQAAVRALGAALTGAA